MTENNHRLQFMKNDSTTMTTTLSQELTFSLACRDLFGGGERVEEWGRERHHGIFFLVNTTSKV